MKIGVIQASSQKEKNALLYQCVKKAVPSSEYEVINFGTFQEEDLSYSYIEIAVMISLLIESKSIDFIVTGCSSGQGIMLACNSLPGVICGYVKDPADAYLFGRINNGNAISFPLGLDFGWAAEINLQCALEKLFSEPFGGGYPAKDAGRKQADTNKLKQINAITKKSMLDIIYELDSDLVYKAVHKGNVYQHIIEHGTNKKLLEVLNDFAIK